MSQHRWSGWPGAWCLDCGQEDQNEACLAHCHIDLESMPCEKHRNGPCPHPGSRMHDPYYTKKEESDG